MSDTGRHALLFSLATVSAFASVFGTLMTIRVYDQYATDNQTISTLRSQLAESKRYLSETEAAMIQGAKDNEALRDQLHLRDLNDALRKEKSRL